MEAEIGVVPAHATATMEQQALRLMATILWASLVLQRLGPTVVGSSYVSVMAPIGLLLMAYGLMRGLLVIHRARAVIFVVFIGWMVAGTALRACLPDRYGTSPSWMSLTQFVAVTGFGTLVLAQPISEARFFRMINLALGAIAVAGIVQFIVQFAGLQLFSFTTFIPSEFLLEGPYATVIPIGDSGYFKSNGLFLVEPSVFSQFMALAIIIEMLLLRRSLYLALFAAGLMTSISGTGWLMIFSFVITAAFSLGFRGLLISVTTLLVVLLGLGGLAVLFPSGFALFIDRTDEIYAIGSSGHSRFVTPWWLVDFVLSRTPWAAFYGLGAGVSEHLAMRPPWDYTLNPPAKIVIEYGIPCFVLYVWFLLTGRKTSVQKALVVPVLVLLLVDGGYQQFPPVLFPAMMLIMTAELVPAAAQVRRRPAIVAASVPG